ncbi:LytTR family DNA-binding domain-containing protein [uncultured Acetatifactor sp.]|uniref:LytR/AlgR family response regulator transcription factor n=1 Tax=uncultured Acetatifactor sp. TaxID=1671927 RepID=UPI002630879E|nr:response regulator transcription factor [uncultured Acetatifactor sp.]
MKIAIIDDEQDELDGLSRRVEDQFSLLGYSGNEIHCFHSAEEFFPAWSPGGYDLILMDIYMDGMPGIEAARRIRKQDRDCRLVFSTSSNSFASESYEVGADYYLHKPFTDDDIANMLRKLDLENYELSRSITLPDGKHILLRNIIRTEYHNHVVTISTKNNGQVRTRTSQAEFQSLLSEYPYFCCCSKGIILNFYEVSARDKSMFTMSDGSTVAISRRKEKEVQEAYAVFLFERMRKEMRE